MEVESNIRNSEADEMEFQTINDLKRYIDVNIDILRNELNGADSCETSKLSSDRVLITRLTDEVDFLRDELKTRREEFRQREATLLKIIDVLRADNSQDRAALTRSAEKVAGGSWEKPRRTAPPRIDESAAAIETANRFNSLTPDVESVEQSEHLSPTRPAAKNVTERRKNKKPAKKPSDNTGANNEQREQPVPAPKTAKPPRKEIIILGDSMVKGLKGHLMSKRNVISCHSISGLNLDELMVVGRGLCARKPHVLLVTCGTNSVFPKRKPGATTEPTPMSPDEACKKMREFVTLIASEFPATKVVFSNLIERTDIDGASATIKQVNTLIAQSNIAHVDQSSITSAHLNGSKLHLNQSGDKKLAVNFIEFLRAFLDD